MDLFYHPEFELDQRSLIFSGEEFHHIVKVMRYLVGQEFYVTNGRGIIALARLTNISKNHCESELISFQKFEKPDKKIIALVPILRNLERFEFAIEKLTELGVYKIIPFISERTVKKNFRYERAQKILISAMKQSFNPFLPELSEPISFEEIINSFSSNTTIIYGNPNGKNLSDVIKDFESSIPNEIFVAVGPEGDFSEKELAALKLKDGIAVTLGKNRLRSETALITLLAQLKLFLSD